MISKEEVKHVAGLARLSLSKKERERMQKDLSSILDYIEKLQELDVSEVELESVPKDIGKVSRKDKVETIPEQEKERLRDLMPKEKSGYLKIKKIL